MTSFNRNVITNADADSFRSATTANEMPRTFEAMPPAGATGAALVTVPTSDDYLTKLLKYVPLEVLGAYLFIAGVIESNVDDAGDQAWWLGGLLVGILAITVPYDIRVLNMVRPMQIAMSMVGLAVYVFAIGGWFATTTWYEPWYATLALPLFGLLVAIIRLKPLPTAN